MTGLRQLIKGERGQVLPVVLLCLAVGGLLIAPSITYAATNLHAGVHQQSGTLGLYAADAGVEDVLWSIKGGAALPTSLPQNLNGMQVTMSTENKGNYTLIAGEWVPPNGHSDWLVIDSTMVSDAGAYKYTITATYQGEGQGKVTEVGARLPVGYSYQAGSAALFDDNLSTANPFPDELDGDGAHLLTWTFGQTTLSPTRTQIFYVTGSGELSGDYAWAVLTRSDVGEVGELTGAFYVITATATRPQDGVITARVEANVMKSGSNVYVTSWHILK